MEIPSRKKATIEEELQRKREGMREGARGDGRDRIKEKSYARRRRRDGVGGNGWEGRHGEEAQWSSGSPAALSKPRKALGAATAAADAERPKRCSFGERKKGGTRDYPRRPDQYNR